MGYHQAYSLKGRIFFSRKRFVSTTFRTWNPSSHSFMEGFYQGYPLFSPSKSHLSLRRTALFLRKRAEQRASCTLFSFGPRLFSSFPLVTKYSIACGQPFYFSSYVGGVFTNWRNVLFRRLGGVSRLPSIVLVFDPFRLGNMLSECSLLGIPTVAPVGFKFRPSHVSYPLAIPVNFLRTVLAASLFSKSIISGRRRRGCLVPLSICYQFLSAHLRFLIAMARVPYRRFIRRNKTDPWYKLLSGILKNPPRRYYRSFRIFFLGLMERHRKNFRGFRYGFFRRLVQSFTFPDFRRERPTRVTRYRLVLRSRISFKRFFYPMGEKQLRRLLLSLRAHRQGGGKFQTFYSLFESRLGLVILRSRFLTSPLLVRQEIFHGRVYVNGSPVFFPTYRLSAGDFVTFSRSLSMKIRSHFFNFFRHCLFFGRFASHLLSVPSHLRLCYSVPFIQFTGQFYPRDRKYPFSLTDVIAPA